MSTQLETLKLLVLWISRQTDELAAPADRRARMSLACLDLAIEHQAGISVLAQQPLWGPVYALLRCLLDAFVRGVWLARCASEEDLNAFESDGLRKKSFATLVQEVERILGHTRGILSKLYKSSWAMFSDFTHTEFEHVTCENSPTHIGRNYPIAETEQALRLAIALGLLAATELADLSGNRKVALACKKHAQQFASAS